MPYRILIDSSDIIRAAEFVELLREGDIEVSLEQFNLAVDHIGDARWIDGAVRLPPPEEVAPPPPPPPPPLPHPGFIVFVDENDFVTSVQHVDVVGPDDIEISATEYDILRAAPDAGYRFQNGMIVAPPQPEPPSDEPFYRLILDEEGLITGAEVVDALEEGDVGVSAAQYAEASAFIGTMRWIDGALVAPPPPAPALAPRMLAIAQLTIEGEVINGIETAVGVGFAFAIDINVYWIFFPEPEPDADYIVFVQTPGFNADVTDRQTDYFEITVTDRATGEAAAPTRMSLSVQRTT